jgi:hypothetical protein
MYGRAKGEGQRAKGMEQGEGRRKQKTESWKLK